MIPMRMHTPWRDQAYEMTGTAGLPQPLDQASESGRMLDLAIGNRRADTRQVLHYNAASANVECPTSEFPICPCGNPTSGPTFALERAGKCPTDD
jgi:hypothetical protein